MSDPNSIPDFHVTLSPHQTLPKGLKPEKVTESAEFVLEILLAYLPDELPLDGSSSIEIRLGDSGDDPRYKRSGKKSVVYQSAFDFGKWKRAKIADKDELMLEALGGIVDRVAHAFRGDRKAVKDAIRQAIKKSFEATIPMPELHAEVPDCAKGEEIQVVRTLSRQGETWTVEVRGKQGRVIQRDSIGEGLDPDEARKKFQDFKWKENEFVLVNGRGRATYSLQLETNAHLAA